MDFPCSDNFSREIERVLKISRFFQDRIVDFPCCDNFSREMKGLKNC